MYNLLNPKNMQFMQFDANHTVKEPLFPAGVVILTCYLC